MHKPGQSPGYFVKKSIISLIFGLLFSVSLFSQEKEYILNSPGSQCFVNYICYTADSNYADIRRPFIFIIGEGEISSRELFEKDTLKRSEELQNYYYVYLPGQGESSAEKLSCLQALVSLLTFSYRYGRSNLFLQVNDTLIDYDDVKKYRLNTIFRTIRLASESRHTENSITVQSSVFDDFKEEIEGYAPEEKTVEDLAKYYFLDSGSSGHEVDDAETSNPVRTFFGPPENFNFTLSGIIRDESTGEPLPYASITVSGTTTGTSTNTDGLFTLLKVPTDTSTLLIHYVGYRRTPVFLTPQTPRSNFTVYLEPQSQTLDEVKITAHRDDIEFVRKEGVSSIKLTPVKLEQLPGVGDKDIMRSFQLMPGISASNESSSGLYVRGGTPDQNLVLYDGFTVYHVDHLYGFFSAFNSNALKDIQLYKGGFESKFGGRISSVTEITSKEGNQKRINFGADISLLSTNFFAEIPVGTKFTSFLAFRKSYQGEVYDLIFKKFNRTRTEDAPDIGTGPGRRFSQNTEIASYFYDLNGKFTLRPSDKDIISLSIFNGTDKLDNSFSSDVPSFGQFNSNFSMNSVDLTKYGNIGSSLKWSRRWNSRLYGNSIISYSNYYNNRNRSSERTLINSDNEASVNMSGIFEDNDLKDFSFKSDFEWKLADISQMEFGIFATYYSIKYSYSQSDTASILNRDGIALLSGAYLQNDLKLFNDLIHIIPGIRANYFGNTGKLYFEPRLSVSAGITKHLVLKGSTGKYYQFANRVTREDIMSGNKEFWVLADGISVPVSSSVHLIAGLSYETSEYTLSAEGYFKRIRNLTEYSLRINASPLGMDYNENFFNGYGYSRGVEFLVQKNSGNLNGWISYTFGEARNHFDEYSDTYYHANQDVTHEFKIVGLYKYRRWDFSANWIYATGRPYTAPSGAYTITLLDGTTKDYFTVTSKNSIRLSDYHRFDVSATYKLLMGKRTDNKRRELGSVSVSLFNVYNRKNIWYKQFTIEEGEILQTNINYLGITPNITLSLKLR